MGFGEMPEIQPDIYKQFHVRFHFIAVFIEKCECGMHAVFEISLFPHLRQQLVLDA